MFVRRQTRGCGLVAVIWVLAACSNPVDPELLVSFEGGAIRVEELDQHILNLPAQRRITFAGRPPQVWLEEALERIFLLKVVATNEALQYLRSDFAYQQNLETALTRALAARYVRETAPDFQPTEEVLRSKYDPSRWGSPEKRLVHNLLLAFPEDADEALKETIRQRAQSLRKQIVAGASFEKLAREHSQSATAREGGLVGTVARTDLRREAADFIFSLTPGQVSEVLETRAGCQLFLVKAVLPEIDPTFQEIKPQLEAMLRLEISKTWWELRLQEMLVNDGLHLPAWPESGLPEGIRADSAVFNLGDRVLFAGDVMAHAGASKRYRDSLITLIGEWYFARQWERLFPEEAARFRRQKEREFALVALRGKAVKEYAAKEDWLRLHYDAHPDRYQVDPAVGLTLFSWPIGKGDPLDALHTPNQFAERLRQGHVPEESPSAPTLRESLTLTHLRELALARPEIARSLPEGLAPGMVIGPLRHYDRILVIRVDAYNPAKQISFEEARARVSRDLVQSQGSHLERQWLSQLKADHKWKIYRNNLDHFGSNVAQIILGD